MQKIILITGSSRGIGFAIAKTFAYDKDFSVVIASRKKPDLEKAVQEIRSETKNQNVFYFQCNFTDMKQIQSLFDFVNGKWGKLDILVNNVALSLHFGPIMETSESQFDKMITGNIKSHFVTSQKFLPIMKPNLNSSIIFISSFVGIAPDPSIGIYSMTKGALINLSIAMSKELADKGIRVNCVCPGLIKTDFSRPLWEGGNPIMKIGHPDDISNTVYFLCSSKGKFINGAVIPVVGQPVSSL